MPNGTGTAVGLVESQEAGFLQGAYQAFVALGPKILNLQHRAALAKQAATQRGDAAAAALADRTLRELGDLLIFHQQTENRLDAIVAYIPGLGAFPLIPIAIVASVVGVAAAVALVFRLFNPLERMVEDVLERPDLTVAEQSQLIESIGGASAMGGGMFAGLGDAARWIVLGVGAWAAWQWWQERGGARA